MYQAKQYLTDMSNAELETLRGEARTAALYAVHSTWEHNIVAKSTFIIPEGELSVLPFSDDSFVCALPDKLGTMTPDDSGYAEFIHILAKYIDMKKGEA